MDDITRVCNEYISNNQTNKYAIHMPSIVEFHKILESHRALFKAQDAVYAHLRLTNKQTQRFNLE